MTRAEADRISGQVYAWLTKQNIGREDFVLICLPRGVRSVTAMLGVWKAGAALIIAEESYAEERIEFIKKDCGCKAVIDLETWQEILKEQSRPGYVHADMHDAAFAVYTSGSTGTPKGVLHEYGSIKLNALSVQNPGIKEKNDRVALVAPLYFVAAVKTVLNLIYGKHTLYILPYSISKNPKKLKKFFHSNRIMGTFFSPSLIRAAGRGISPYLKVVHTGSEPVNGVFLDDVTLVNNYSMSESCFTVCQFILDHSYNVCPVGKPNYEELKIHILDDLGNEVPHGGIGEICFEDPFFRGYINMPEETEKVMRDGLYHSSDLGRFNENGELVLLGRANDMIKINGNRIEPAEIEATFKAVTGKLWCAAKGFENPDQSFIALYYQGDPDFDARELQRALETRLPYYMIPSYYVKLDKIPLLPNGKLDRRSLPMPERRTHGADYAAPATDVQMTLCSAFESVLKLDRVGIRDDFYQLGGDSLGTMEIAGKYFDSDKPVEASVPVMCKSGEADLESYFYPYLDSVIENGDTSEVRLILRPYNGTFTDELKKDKVTLDGVLKDSEIVSLEKVEDSDDYELVMNVKSDLKESDYGTVTLAKECMTNSKDEVSYTREISAGTVGRVLDAYDLGRVKEIVNPTDTENYLATFNTHFESMVKYTNEVDKALKNNSKKIDALAEKLFDENDEGTKMDQEDIDSVLWDFASEVVELKQSTYNTIAKKLALVEEEYTVCMTYMKNDNSNPISRYCQLFQYVDNFSTTSLTAKKAFAYDLKYQFDRTLSYLILLGGKDAQSENIELFNNAYYPDIEAEATNKNGDPYCYLMRGYVEIASDAASKYYKSGTKNKYMTILDEEDVTEFRNRMKKDTLKEELVLAGFDENKFLKMKTNFSSSDFGSGGGCFVNDYYVGIGFNFKNETGNWNHGSNYKQYYPRMDGIFNYLKDDANSFVSFADGLYYEADSHYEGGRNKFFPCAGYVTKAGSYYKKGWYVIEPMAYFRITSR